MCAHSWKCACHSTLREGRGQLAGVGLTFHHIVPSGWNTGLTPKLGSKHLSVFLSTLSQHLASGCHFESISWQTLKMWVYPVLRDGRERCSPACGYIWHKRSVGWWDRRAVKIPELKVRCGGPLAISARGKMRQKGRHTFESTAQQTLGQLGDGLQDFDTNNNKS